MRERKRHTARRVASTPPGRGGGTPSLAAGGLHPGVPPILTWPGAGGTPSLAGGTPF